MEGSVIGGTVTTGTAPLSWGEKTSDEMCLAFAYVTAK